MISIASPCLAAFDSQVKLFFQQDVRIDRDHPDRTQPFAIIIDISVSTKKNGHSLG